MTEYDFDGDGIDGTTVVDTDATRSPAYRASTRSPADPPVPGLPRRRPRGPPYVRGCRTAR